MSPRLPAFSLAILIGAVTVSACAGPENTPGPSSASPSSATASGPPADDPPGTRACAKASRALRDGTVMNPGVVTDITTAAATADAPVLEAAQALAAAYTKAVAAHGADAEPDAIAAVSAAAAELTRICAASGLEVAG
jgi:hypothetical protein